MPGFHIPLVNECHDIDAFRGRSTFDGPTNSRETARKHRYSLEVVTRLGEAVLGDRDRGMLLFLNKCTRPSVEIDQITIHNGQDEIFRPGKHHWNPVEFTFYEVLNDSDPPTENQAAASMFRWWAENTIDIRRSRIMPPEFTADCELDMLDGSGNSVWTYHLYRAWPIKIAPADLSYSSSEISEISATLRFDKAFEEVRTRTVT